MQAQQPIDAAFADSLGLTPLVIQPLNTRMRRVMDRARHLAGDPAPLLLRGEFGVGKRVLAGLIHRWGPVAQLPAFLVRAGSETPYPAPVTAAHPWRSESRGTMVLEEIGEFTLAQQGEILALIAANESAKNTPETRPEGVKIVATSSQDLSAAAGKGQFREDLLSFLLDEALYLPPLRERPEDIAPLAEQMFAQLCRLYHRPALTIDPDTKLELTQYSWPGNVHELRNAIERVVLTAKGPVIGESEFRPLLAAESCCNRSGQFLSLDAMEKQHILRVLKATSTLEEAARILHVDITTLWRKRRRYGV